MPYCCERLTKAVKDKIIVHTGKEWAVAGCCGQCLLIAPLGVCPFCLDDLPARKRATEGAGRYYKDEKGKRKTRKDKLTNQPSLMATE